MKLTLKDFGPIDEFTLDLTKDIQFIYGENSVGKSYAVFVLYAVTKAFENLRGHPFNKERVLRESKIQDYQTDIENAAKEAEGKRIKINSHIVGSLKSLFAQSAKSLEKILLTKFSSLSEFSNTKTKNNFCIKLDLGEFSLTFTPRKSESAQSYLEFHVTPSREREVVYIKYKNVFICYRDGSSETFSHPHNPDVHFLWELATLIDVLIFPKIEEYLQQTYLIPANRTGIYLSLNSFAPLIAELSANRSLFQNPSIGLATFSQDIADYIIHFSRINPTRYSKLLIPFINKLEKDILKGQISFDYERKRIVYYSHDTDLVLDLAQTSSMIAEASIITTFFKYIVRQDYALQKKINNTVIIEEPESHLHPKTQVALMELFAELPKYGIKLIVTSHSDFMFSKLGNMIIDGKIDPNTVGTYRMVMGEKGSYDAGDMKPTKDGVKDHNFVEISEKLYEERVDIYDRLNEEHVAAEYHKK